MIEYKLMHIEKGKIISVDTFYDYESFEEMLWLSCDIKRQNVTIAVIITTPKR